MECCCGSSSFLSRSAKFAGGSLYFDECQRCTRIGNELILDSNGVVVASGNSARTHFQSTLKPTQVKPVIENKFSQADLERIEASFPRVNPFDADQIVKNATFRPFKRLNVQGVVDGALLVLDFYMLVDVDHAYNQSLFIPYLDKSFDRWSSACVAIEKTIEGMFKAPVTRVVFAQTCGYPYGAILRINVDELEAILPYPSDTSRQLHDEQEGKMCVANSHPPSNEIVEYFLSVNSDVKSGQQMHLF